MRAKRRIGALRRASGLRHWCGLSAAALALAGCDSGPSGPLPARPNLVLIVTDDLDWSSVQHLPRLQSLAEEGLTFDNFFVTSSSCTPSRASILRGQYPHNHAVITDYAPRGGFEHWHELGRDGSTLGTWLQAAGYRTGVFGKYMNLYPDGVEETYVAPGWDAWHVPLQSHYYDFRINENGAVKVYACCEMYETDLLASRAADFIREAGAEGDPFFAYLVPFAPHEPATPAARHEGAFAGVTPQRAPSFNEEDVRDKPGNIRSRPLMTDAEIAEMDEGYRQRLRTMLAVEDMIDSVVTAVAESGQTDRTLIFFTSDNGFHFNEHRLGAFKVTAYDEDIRVPLLVAGPGIPRGAVAHDIVLNQDLAPTLAQLAGAAPSNLVDGRSIVPLLAGAAGDVGRNGLLVERWRRDPERPPPYAYNLLGYRAVRTNDYLYVEWDTGEFELYDRRSDPWEMENLYQRADPEFLARLVAWADRLSGCAGAACQAAEDEAPPQLRLIPE